MTSTPVQQMSTHDAFSPTLTTPEEEGRSRFCGVRDFFDRVDEYVTTSKLGYFFRLGGTGHVS